jgi:hypothetical protein
MSERIERGVLKMIYKPGLTDEALQTRRIIVEAARALGVLDEMKKKWPGDWTSDEYGVFSHAEEAEKLLPAWKLGLIEWPNGPQEIGNFLGLLETGQSHPCTGKVFDKGSRAGEPNGRGIEWVNGKLQVVKYRAHQVAGYGPFGTDYIVLARRQILLA